MTLAAILVLAAGTYALRAAGPLFYRRCALSPAASWRISLAATTLLAALVAVAAVLPGGRFGGYALPCGVAVGAVAAWRRLPFVVCVVAAAASTALLRLAGVP